MKKTIYSLGFCLVASQLSAQVVSSTEFFVSDGAVVSFGTNVVNEGKMTNNGKIVLQKDFQNSGEILSSGVVEFNGNGRQVLKSEKSISLANVTLNNDVKLETPLTVTQELAFRRGVIESNADSPLTFSSDATHSGASDYSHVRGVVKRDGGANFEFPLGDGTNYRAFNASNTEGNTLIAEYISKSPLNISNDLSQQVDAINENEFWSLRSSNASASAKVALNNNSSNMEEVAYLKRGTWEVAEDAKFSAATDLNNGTLFTYARARNIKPAIGIWPNPSDGVFNLKLSGMDDNEAIMVDVTNQDGRVVMHLDGSVKSLRKEYTLPNDLNATELTVRVIRGEKAMTQKLILNK